MGRIADNIDSVKARIRKAAEKAHRSDRDIKLVCVTKTATVEQIEEALAAGITDIGESYIQEAEKKFAKIGYRPKWHLVGHLQTNKAKEAARIFDMIQSVDSMRLAEEISKRSAGQPDPKKILLEIKTSEEATKFGISPEGAMPLAEWISELPNVRIVGLMTMAPFTEDPEASRLYFQRLRKLALLMSGKRIKNVSMDFLSMGMTQDFEVAIEEGANILRIGHAIFNS